MSQLAHLGPTHVGSPSGPARSGRLATRLLALIMSVGAALVMIPVQDETQPAPSAGGSALGYQLPVDDVVLRRLDLPVHRWSPGHRGIDIAATAGTPVRAPADGVVTVSRRVVDREVLTIEHPDGLRSSLEPLAGGVAEGTVVLGGSVVGTVADGGTHCGGADCLHWGVRRGAQYLDPLSLLPGAAPVVLLAEGQQRSLSWSVALSRSIAAVCICEMRDSVTPRTRPISASVIPS
jgi:murein DD-endopeptidase MepM/ murein hydrolase activator NlpD